MLNIVVWNKEMVVVWEFICNTLKPYFDEQEKCECISLQNISSAEGVFVIPFGCPELPDITKFSSRLLIISPFVTEVKGMNIEFKEIKSEIFLNNGGIFVEKEMMSFGKIDGGEPVLHTKDGFPIASVSDNVLLTTLYLHETTLLLMDECKKVFLKLIDVLKEKKIEEVRIDPSSALLTDKALRHITRRFYKGENISENDLKKLKENRLARPDGSINNEIFEEIKRKVLSDRRYNILKAIFR
jgi:hypothetical protein